MELRRSVRVASRVLSIQNVSVVSHSITSLRQSRQVHDQPVRRLHGSTDEKQNMKKERKQQKNIDEAPVCEDENPVPKKKARVARLQRTATEVIFQNEESNVRKKVKQAFQWPEVPVRRAGRKLVGPHVSTAGGIHLAVRNAVLCGATAFALDTRSKRKWDCPPLSAENAELFREACVKYGFEKGHVLPHGSYLINCGSPDQTTLAKSREALVEEMTRCEMLGLQYYNFHPGSTCGLIPKERSIELIAESINLAHERVKSVTAVVENMAGQGNVIGGSFEDLKRIIDLVHDKQRIGVCLDTCHMFAAGYDIRTKEKLNLVLDQFDRIVGFQYLKGMHLNDSKGDLSCKRDLHECIGVGKLGLECFRAIMNQKRLDSIPLILETPTASDKPDRLEHDKAEINLLYSLIEQPEVRPNSA
eukprot:GILJ01008746.1.p1 GENE.GILJ01008746.1~~GILJ01008746.1.p1  ORF type:complete len:417 (-),score=62.41 GILJ01008746.1:327-1577(-)